MKARHHLMAGLAVAGLFVAIVAGLKYAARIDLIELDIAVRATQTIIGLSLAVYANFIPKNLGSWRGGARSAARAQSALRVGGWSFMLGGLAYAAMWAAAPIALADALSIPVIASAIMVTLGYSAWALGSCAISKRGREAS